MPNLYFLINRKSTTFVGKYEPYTESLHSGEGVIGEDEVKVVVMLFTILMIALRLAT